MLGQRVFSAVLFGPLVLAAAWAGGRAWLMAVGLLVAMALVELRAMFRRRDLRLVLGTAAPVAAALLVAAYRGLPELFAAALVAAVILPLLAQVLRPGRHSLADSAFTAVATVYAGLGAYLLWLGRLGGGRLAVWAIVLTWVYDTTAYFAGRAWGRRKLAPSLSPGKTWEGAVAGLAATVAVGLSLGAMAGIDPVVGGAASALAAALAQAGDLVESALKRFAGVKDAGSVIPGHGGVLDRFDSLLLVGFGLYVFFLVVGV